MPSGVEMLTHLKSNPVSGLITGQHCAYQVMPWSDLSGFFVVGDNREVRAGLILKGN